MIREIDSSTPNLESDQRDALTYDVARAFEEMVDAVLAQRGWTLREIAMRLEPSKTEDTAVGVASKIHRGKNRKALLDRGRMQRWADVLRLDGAERERFLFLARLASAPNDIERDHLDLIERVSRLEHLARVRGLLSDA